MECCMNQLVPIDSSRFGEGYAASCTDGVKCSNALCNETAASMER